jgi:hypothetical protein
MSVPPLLLYYTGRNGESKGNKDGQGQLAFAAAEMTAVISPR